MKQKIDEADTDKWVADVMKEYLENGGDIYKVANKTDEWPPFFDYRPYIMLLVEGSVPAYSDYTPYSRQDLGDVALMVKYPTELNPLNKDSGTRIGRAKYFLWKFSQFDRPGGRIMAWWNFEVN